MAKPGKRLRSKGKCAHNAGKARSEKTRNINAAILVCKVKRHITFLNACFKRMMQEGHKKAGYNRGEVLRP